MNFKTIFSIGLCSGFLLVGCSDPERETITQMKAHLTGKSPEFRNVDGYCGEVSYVDSSGKRSQYKHFIASDDIGKSPRYRVGNEYCQDDTAGGMKQRD